MFKTLSFAAILSAWFPAIVCCFVSAPMFILRPLSDWRSKFVQSHEKSNRSPRPIKSTPHIFFIVAEPPLWSIMCTRCSGSTGRGYAFLTFLWLDAKFWDVAALSFCGWGERGRGGEEFRSSRFWHWSHVEPWITNGDQALDFGCDCWFVKEHVLNLARARNGGKSLSPVGCHSDCAAACQHGAFLGHTGGGCVCVWGVLCYVCLFLNGRVWGCVCVRKDDAVFVNNREEAGGFGLVRVFSCMVSRVEGCAWSRPVPRTGHLWLFCVMLELSLPAILLIWWETASLISWRYLVSPQVSLLGCVGVEQAFIERATTCSLQDVVGCKKSMRGGTLVLWVQPCLLLSFVMSNTTCVPHLISHWS